MDVITYALCKGNGGGGSGGLPTPTAEDIGKVATVVGETSKGAVIVPKQTVFGTGSPVTLTAENADMFTTDAAVIITVTASGGETSYNSVVEPVEIYGGSMGYQAYFGNDGWYIVKIGNTFTLNGVPELTIVEISCNLAQTNVSWGMESASSGGVLVVNGTWSDDGCTLDKTWQEIHDGGFGVVAMTDEHDITYCPIVNVTEGIEGVGYYNVMVIFYGDSLDIMQFTASSASGYPVWSE